MENGKWPKIVLARSVGGERPRGNYRAWKAVSMGTEQGSLSPEDQP